MPNAVLLKQTLDRIREESEKPWESDDPSAELRCWDQGKWIKRSKPGLLTPACRAVMCFAGWAVALDSRSVIADNQDFTSGMWVAANDVEGWPAESLPYRAARLLEITHDQSTMLFSGGNTLYEIELLVEGLTRNA